jgi:hypothetical protein
MSTTNNTGDQTVYPRYKFPVDGEFVAEMLETIIDPGIWDGLDVTVVDSSTLRFAPGTMVLDDSGDRLVKSEFDSAFEANPTESDPYVVARYTWVDEEVRFAEIRIDDSFDNYDVVLTKAEFDNSGNITGFDNTDRTLPRLVQLDNQVL